MLFLYLKLLILLGLSNIRISEKLKKEIESNKSNIDNLKKAKDEFNKIDNKQIEKYIEAFLSLENPIREFVTNLIEKIYIYQDKQ
jgi:hypothetical protein